ncbi:hypothetical protein OROGR_013019 [Orobanche gracilis]
MATNLSIASVPCHLHSDTTHHRPLHLTTPYFLFSTRKRFTINSSKKAPPPPPSPSAGTEEQKNPSLAEQLKPLSTIILSDQPNETHLLSKPKPTWVNPTKPKPSVLSLQRHKRSSSYSHNPHIKDLMQFAKGFNDCEESDFLAVIEGIPHPPTRENALLVLNSLRPWQKSLPFFNWVKAQNVFPVETIFYNVIMKSLRFGRQFQHIENLAFEMIEVLGKTRTTSQRENAEPSFDNYPKSSITTLRLPTSREQANPKLAAFVKMLCGDEINSGNVKEEFKIVLSNTDVEARGPFSNCLIDICRSRNLHERAHELLHLGTIYGLYPGLHTKSEEEWRLNLRSLSIGAAHTAFEEWMGTLAKIIRRQERLPALFSANTGSGAYKYPQGLGNALASHVQKLSAPFIESKGKSGFFVATREDLVSWVDSKAPLMMTPACTNH